jgi:hypothetical protein
VDLLSNPKQIENLKLENPNEQIPAAIVLSFTGFENTLIADLAHTGKL